MILACVRVSPVTIVPQLRWHDQWPGQCLMSESCTAALQRCSSARAYKIQLNMQSGTRPLVPCRNNWFIDAILLLVTSFEIVKWNFKTKSSLMSEKALISQQNILYLLSKQSECAQVSSSILMIVSHLLWGYSYMECMHCDQRCCMYIVWGWPAPGEAGASVAVTPRPWTRVCAECGAPCSPQHLHTRPCPREINKWVSVGWSCSSPRPATPVWRGPTFWLATFTLHYKSLFTLSSAQILPGLCAVRGKLTFGHVDCGLDQHAITVFTILQPKFNVKVGCENGHIWEKNCCHAREWNILSLF